MDSRFDSLKHITWREPRSLGLPRVGLRLPGTRTHSGSNSHFRPGMIILTYSLPNCMCFEVSLRELVWPFVICNIIPVTDFSLILSPRHISNSHLCTSSEMLLMVWSQISKMLCIFGWYQGSILRTRLLSKVQRREDGQNYKN